MPLAVFNPIVVRTKVLLAVPALVRLFQRVDAHVGLQQLTTRVRLFTTLEGAPVRPFTGMVADVFYEGRLGFVGFVASGVGTGVRFFVGVGSPVYGQIGFGVATFFAEFAREGRFVFMPVPFVQFEGRFGLEADAAVLADEGDSEVVLLVVSFEGGFELEACGAVWTLEFVLQLVGFLLGSFVVEGGPFGFLGDTVGVIFLEMIGEVLSVEVGPFAGSALDSGPAVDREGNTIFFDSVTMLAKMCFVLLLPQKGHRTDLARV